MEWISVKDRLPEFERVVLLYWKWSSGSGTEYESYKTGCLVEVTTRKSSDGIVNYPEFHIDDDWSNTNPTHWMPLPEPPKQ